MDTATVRRPPFGVSFLSIFLVIGGVLDIVAGIVLFTQRNDDDLLDAIGSESSDISTFAVVAIAFGIVVLLVASALRNGANWARLLIGIIAVARIVAFIVAAVAYHRIHWYDALAPVAIYSIVAGYLFFHEESKAYFRGT